MSKYIHKKTNVTVLLYHLVSPAKYRRAVFEERVDQESRIARYLFLGVQKSLEKIVEYSFDGSREVSKKGYSHAKLKFLNSELNHVIPSTLSSVTDSTKSMD